MDYRLPGSSVHGILQARILEWVDPVLLQWIFLIQGLNPRFLHLSALAGVFFTTSTTWEAPAGWVGAPLIPSCVQFRGLT